LDFLFGIEKNRTVSNEPKKHCQISTLAISKEGLKTHLKNFGFIKLFRKDLKKEDSRHYMVCIPEEENIEKITRTEFIEIHDTHWGIETFHRAVKKLCGICRFMVRDSNAIKTHIFCSLNAFVRLEITRSKKIISNWYEVQRNLFTSVIREYILMNSKNNAISYNP
jgi:hypothetical protein